MVCNSIYVYIGFGIAFIILVAVYVGRVRYTSFTFEEQDDLFMMHLLVTMSPSRSCAIKSTVVSI
jgi:hypothetical protein